MDALDPGGADFDAAGVFFFLAAFRRLLGQRSRSGYNRGMSGARL